jgi:hypothetical protein
MSLSLPIFRTTNGKVAHATADHVTVKSFNTKVFRDFLAELLRPGNNSSGNWQELVKLYQRDPGWVGKVAYTLRAGSGEKSR